MKMGICGICGRMGREILTIILDKGHTLAAGADGDLVANLYPLKRRAGAGGGLSV